MFVMVAPVPAEPPQLLSFTEAVPGAMVAEE